MKLILIDGYGFVFRAYHSLPPLTTPDGSPIGAVYGFTNMLYKFLSSHTADYIAVVLDSGVKNFRHDIYKEYKANRPPAPDDLIPQFPIIREAVEAFNIRAIEEIGLEADDLIAAYAREAEAKGMEVVIISSDKDLMQLITDKISLYDAMRDRPINAPEVFEKFGVTPDKVVDSLALIGDSSDNIPGVVGIGPKTAAELINQFGSLEALYENIDNLPPSKKQITLKESRDKAFLSKSLIELNRNIKLKIPLDELEVKDIDKAKLAKFLQQKGFKALLAKVGVDNLDEHKHVEIKETEFQTLKTIAELEKVFPKIIKQGVIALHISHTFIEISAHENFKLSFDDQPSDLFTTDKMKSSNILQALKPLLEDPAIIKYGYDLKPLYKKLIQLNISLANHHDVAVLAYCLNTGNNSLELKKLIELFLLLESEPNSRLMYELGVTLRQKIIEHKIITLYEEIDRPIQTMLAEIELKGVKIDSAKLLELTTIFNAKAAELQKEIFEIAGEEFNIASPKQLAIILFEKLKFGSKNKKKSTGVEVLEDLALEGHKIASLILEWRQFKKLTSTYTEPLPKAINPKTGRVHTTLLSTVTTTGRLSSQNPNLQNIPIRTKNGNMIRAAFVGSPGNQLISADYSQIELRLLAEIADISKLKQAFKNGIDIHTATASEVFGVDVNQVDSEMRRKAKTINFGIIYGVSAYGLAERLGIPRNAAQEYITLYFSRYPEIKTYMDKTIEFARKTGYVETLFSRKCEINGINDKNFTLRAFAERAAINAPLQGTASDIIKLAMLNLPAQLRQYLVLQIHDELLFDVPTDLVQSFIPQIKKAMENVIRYSIPMTAEVRSGHSWVDAH